MKYYAFMFVCILAFVCVTPYAYKALPEKLRSSVRSAEETSFMTEESEDAAEADEEKICALLASLCPEDTPAEALRALAVVLRTNEKSNNGISSAPPLFYCPQPVRDAVYATSGMTLTYHGETINAVYHTSSLGFTENAADIPYLVSVPTPDDDSFSQTRAYTADEFALLLESNGINVDASLSHRSWLTYISRTDTGRIKRVFLCGSELSGSDFKNLLGFDSTDITVETTEKGFVFTSHGSGGGVGLSVCGCVKMAESGIKSDEILKHYYTGVDITHE